MGIILVVRKNAVKQKSKCKVTLVTARNKNTTRILPGILYENAWSNNSYNDSPNDNERSDNEISNKGSLCNVEDSIIVVSNPINKEVDNEVDINLLGDEW